jgi:ureidoacrylate peracid hydrolase
VCSHGVREARILIEDSSTGRDAFFHDYEVVVLSDATAAGEYPDIGQGAMSGAEVHRASLIILAQSTADVMTAETFMSRIAASAPAPIRAR